jgi:transcriptional regulator with XRE-family HTH domain
MKKSKSELGQLIKDYRVKANMTQKDLSYKLGYDIPQFLCLMENGHSKIPLYVLEKVIEILNVPEKKVLDILVNNYRQEVLEQISSGKKAVK